MQICCKQLMSGKFMSGKLKSGKLKSGKFMNLPDFNLPDEYYKLCSQITYYLCQNPLRFAFRQLSFCFSVCL